MVITDKEFAGFQRFIFDAAGITLAASKKPLVMGRLSKRVSHHGLASYADYLRLLRSGAGAGEAQVAVDLLTTNETYFFREPKHFEFLKQLAQAAAAARRPLRVWSAACSTGEEPYSIAMVLDDVLGPQGWEILATDISTRVLRRARTGHYPMERIGNIPQQLLRKYCRRGMGAHEGSLLVERSLRERVQFAQFNLTTPPPRSAGFDAVFLRNVMIYFNPDTKRQVVSHALTALRPEGHLFIGHSENLNGISDVARPVAPSVYQKPA